MRRPRRVRHRRHRADRRRSPSATRWSQRLLEAGGLEVAPKQAWTPVAEFTAGGHRRGQLRPGRPRRRTARDESVEIAALVRCLPGRSRRSAPADDAPLPRPRRGLATYPFVRLTEAKRRAGRARASSVLDFGIGEPREETPAFIREALAAGVRAASTYPLAEGLPELRAAIAGWVARGASASRSTRRPRSSRRSAPRRRSSSSRRCSRARRCVASSRRRATRSPSAARCSPARGVLELPLLRRDGFLPDLDAVRRRPGRASALLWLNYPNNPTGAVGAARALRAAGRARRASTTSCSPPTRPTASLVRRRAAGLGAPGRRPHERRRVQHAVQALGDDRLPLGLRGRRPAARSRRSSASGPTSAPRRRSSSSAPPCRLERRGARRRPCARLPRQARRPAAARCERRACASPAARRRFTCGSRCPAASVEAFAGGCSSAASCVAPGRVLRAGRRGLRAARARAHRWRVRERGAPAGIASRTTL